MSTSFSTTPLSNEMPTVTTAVRSKKLAVLVSATAMMGLGFGFLALTSVFIRPLEAEFGWTRAEVSFSYAAATAGMALGGVFWGRISDRVGIRSLMAIGGAGIVLPAFFMAIVQSLWQLYLANLVLGGLGFAVLYTPMLSATSEWFERRQGLAVGIVTAGGALGQGVLPFAANVLIDSVGWRLAFLGLAIGSLVGASLALPQITRPGRTSTTARSATSSDASSSPGETVHLVLLAVAGFLCCTCMGVPMVHMANFVGAVCASPSLGATSLLVAMLFGTAGRIWFGYIADRIGYLPSYALASAIQTACVFLYPLLGDGTSFLVLSAVFGFGFAGNMTCLILCVREAVPPQRFGGSLGLTLLIAWIGMGVGGYAGGALFDMTLSYTLSFAMAGAAGVLNLATIGAAMIWARRRRGLPLQRLPRAG
jgi:MFS family permease